MHWVGSRGWGRAGCALHPCNPRQAQHGARCRAGLLELPPPQDNPLVLQVASRQDLVRVGPTVDVERGPESAGAWGGRAGQQVGGDWQGPAKRSPSAQQLPRDPDTGRPEQLHALQTPTFLYTRHD